MSDITAPARLPGLNQPAPDFDARTTHGQKILKDYQGKWLVLFSHSTDFTPVCTTEFIAFAKRAEEFAARDCELLGLSIDSVHSHIAWVRKHRGKIRGQGAVPDHRHQAQTVCFSVAPGPVHDIIQTLHATSCAQPKAARICA